MMMILLNNMDWVWIGLVIIFLIIETITFSLTTVWAAIACIPLIFISQTKLPIKWQILIFVTITIILIVFTRPFALKKLNLGKYKSNVNNLIGQEVIVIEKLEKFQKGKVRCKDNTIWSAKAFDDKEIDKDIVCKILNIEGNTLIVE